MTRMPAATFFCFIFWATEKIEIVSDETALNETAIQQTVNSAGQGERPNRLCDSHGRIQCHWCHRLRGLCPGNSGPDISSGPPLWMPSSVPAAARALKRGSWHGHGGMQHESSRSSGSMWGSRKKAREMRFMNWSRKPHNTWGSTPPIPRSDVICFDDYVGPGYSLPTPEMAQAVRLLAETEGILLDPVYTGKTMAGLIDLSRKGYFKKGQRVLFVHTGGAHGPARVPKSIFLPSKIPRFFPEEKPPHCP
jgi:hypothetical protein